MPDSPYKLHGLLPELASAVVNKMSKLCAVCTNIFRGKKLVSHSDIHGQGSRTTNDRFALGESDSDSNIEGEGAKRRKVRSFYRHHPSFLELELSANQGCHLCKVLLAQ